MAADLPPRAAELVRLLGLAPHPEGGNYAEVFRSANAVDPLDGRPRRPGLTSIDFLLARGQFSAWHRVASDEAWHLLEGGPLRLWIGSPALLQVEWVDLSAAGTDDSAHRPCKPRFIVPAGWWQAAEPTGAFAYVGATVGPGFDFADFTFGRADPALLEALQRLDPGLCRLL
jgi:predicted cupin superfamily sugar epimerase